MLFCSHSSRSLPRDQTLPALVLGLSLLACSHQPPAETGEPVTSDADSAEVPSLSHLDPKKIVFSLRGEEEGFRKCFMRSMHSKGYVTTQFFVAERGVVEDVKVQSSSVSEESVVQCLRERLLSHRFGASTGPAVGRWTFVFRLSEPHNAQERQRLLKEAERDVRPAVFVEPESPGELDAAKVDEFVQASYPLYAHCYRDSIARAGEAGGVLRLRFRIDRSGVVDKVEDSGSVLPDPFALDCMAEAFYAIRFPPPLGGTATVVYRLDLR